MQRVVTAFLWLAGSSGCLAFNLAPQHAQVVPDPVWMGPDNTNSFGYTVDLLDDREPHTYRIVVGAPKSMSTVPSHQALRDPGVTYTCIIKQDLPIRCEQMVLERNGEARFSSSDFSTSDWNYVDRKENSFIGLSLATHPVTRQVVVCGPGWRNQFYSGYYLMNGVCYSYLSGADTHAEAEKLLPLINYKKQGYQVPTNDTEPKDKSFYYSYGEAGISVHVSDGAEGEVIMGAPGVFMWSGTVIRLRGPKQIPGNFEDINIPNPYLTEDLPTYSYMGYAVGSGRFTHGPHISYVGSAPRVNNTGAVYLFDFPRNTEQAFDIKMKLSGTQMGEYFGAALCVVDIDQDGLDDILIGAPQHTRKELGHEAGDEGRVYAYMNHDGKLVATDAAIMGSQKMAARFGSTITAIGDLNLDGYPDVAVGAPYELPDASQSSGVGTGAVYIYLGQKTGLSARYSQRITARSVGYGIRGFGISVSRGVDVDDNGYLDVVVGAYESGHIVLLRSSPVIHFISLLLVQPTTIQLNTTEFNLTACLTYTGDPKSVYLDANVTVTLDKTQNRVSFENLKSTRSFVMNLRRNVENCKILKVNVKPTSDWNHKTMYSSLMVTMKPSIVKRDVSGFCKTCPIEDPGVESAAHLTIPVLPKCNKETVCVPDWHLQPDFPHAQFPFLIGSRDTLDLRIQVTNHGDTANLRHLNVKLPENVTLRSVPASCEKAENASWDCYNGLLVFSNEKKILELVLDMTRVRVANQKNLKFHFTAFSFDGDDEQTSLEIGVAWDGSVSVVGKAVPDIFVRTADDKLKVAVTHSYHVYNSGHSPVDEVFIKLLVPTGIAIRSHYHSLVEVYQPQVTMGHLLVQCSSDHEFLQDTHGSNKDVRTNRTKRETIHTASILEGRKSTRLDCSRTEVSCMAIACSAGPLLATSQGINIDIHMKISLTSLDILLNQAFQVELETSASVDIVPATRTVHQSVTTRFEGSAIPERDSPFFWWYILLGVVLAVLILALLVYLLFKCKFFERHRVGAEDENKLMTSEGSLTGKNSGKNHDEEGDLVVMDSTPNL